MLIYELTIEQLLMFHGKIKNDFNKVLLSKVAKAQMIQGAQV